MKQLVAIVMVLCVGVLCFFLVSGDDGGRHDARAYVRNHATPDTGALNLVAAIYLGYRAFDTLGETIVLLLAVIGVNLLFVRER